MWKSTYRPAAQMADGVLDDFLGGVAKEHAGLGKVFVETGIAVVGVHGVKGLTGVKFPSSKKMLR